MCCQLQADSRNRCALTWQPCTAKSQSCPRMLRSVTHRRKHGPEAAPLAYGNKCAWFTFCNTPNFTITYGFTVSSGDLFSLTFCV